jgi:hypothetical protein
MERKHWSSYAPEHPRDYNLSHFNRFETVTPHFINAFCLKIVLIVKGKMLKFSLSMEAYRGE